MNIKIMWKKSFQSEREQKRANYTKNVAKAKRILVDSTKYHLIPHLAQLKVAKEIYDALVKWYARSNTNRKLALKNRLHNIAMTKSEYVVSYLMNISQVRDKPIPIRHTIEGLELVSIILNGFYPSWEQFIQGIYVRSKLPTFDELCFDCVQEESKLSSRNNSQTP